MTRERAARRRRGDALPAGASPREHIERAATSKSFPHLAGTVFTLRRRRARPRRHAGDAWTPARTGRRPDDDRRRARPRRLLPGVPVRRRRRPAAGGRRTDRRRVVLLPPRALRRSRPDADVPHARARPRRRTGRGRGRGSDDWIERGLELLGRLGLRGGVGAAPTTRSSGAAAGCSPPTSASRSSSSSCWSPIARSTRPTAIMSFNYHQDHFGERLRHRHGRRARSRTPPASASAWSGSPSRSVRRTASTPPRWPDDGAATALARGARVTVLAACDPARVRPPPRCTAPSARWPETNCYVDVWIELLHALGLEPARDARVLRGHRLRGRPVDVLQAAARRPRGASTASRSRSSPSTGRSPSTSPACSASAGR